MVESKPYSTNSERWLHKNHWDCAEVDISAAGAGGQQSLGAAVAAGKTRRIKALHVRHAGTNNTVLTLLISGGATKRTWDIPPQSTRVIPGAWKFAAAEQPAVQTSDVTGGHTFVGAEGVEA